MDNIRVKEDSLNNWRSGFEIEEGKKKGLDGKACWDGYKLAGTKKKGGKTVDNCVKEDQVDEGAVTTALGISAALSIPYLAKKFLKPKVDKKIEDARNNLKIGGNRRSGTTTEEVQGGVNVENYADGVQFNEIETVDIIKPEPLNASNWRNDLIQVDERYKILKGGHEKNLAAPKNKTIKHGVNDVDYTLMVKNDKKKEVVAASHEVEGDLVDEGLVRGALQGAGLLWKLGKWGIPKAARALKNKGIADITKFKKSQEVVRRVNNIEKIRTTNALKNTDVKGVFTKSKVKPELNRIDWKSTVPKTTPTTSTTSTKRLTSSRPHLDHPTSKGLNYQQKQSKATNIIARIRGNTPTQQKAQKVLDRMNNAINKSNKPGTYSSNVNSAKNIPDPVTSIVPSPSGSLTKITKSSSALVSNRPPKIRPQNKLTGVDLKGLLKSTEKAIPVKPKTNIQRPSGKPAPKPEWGGPRRAPEPEWGTGTPPRSKRAHQAPEPAWGEPKLKDRLTKSSVWPVNKSVSAATGLASGIVSGSSSTKDSKIAKSDTIENPEITQDKKDKEKSNWLEKTRNTSAAKVFSDDERWEAQQKHRKWKDSRKKKKEVSEGAVAAANIASKIPWGKVAGLAMTAIGGTGVLKTTRRDALPDGDIPADIKKQMEDDDSIENSANIPGVNIGRPDLEKHMGTKEKPKAMKDKYDKDALKNSPKDQDILDANKLKGSEKTKRMLEIARKYNKKNKKNKDKK